MPSAARSAVAPAYLLLCLLLGGSNAQGPWANVVLQLIGLAVILWAAIARAGERDLSRRANMLLLLGMAAIAVIALQEVPLPPSFWAYGIHARVAADFRILGVSTQWLPISLTPYEGLAAFFTCIPAVATFIAMVRLDAYRRNWLAAVLLTGTVAGIALGAVQVASAQPTSHWYLYPETNFGSAVGFFANSNHMASLSVLTLPFLAAIAASVSGENRQRRSAILALVAGLGLVILAGIALNRSLAGYALAIPVLAASALIVLPRAGLLRRVAIGIAAISIVGAVVGLASSSIAPGGKVRHDAIIAVQSRAVILKTTAKAIADTMPLGSGLGSFRRVYPLYESPDTVTSEYVVHAHNDYVELALELGAPGIVLMLLFLVWWARAAWLIWRRKHDDPFARAASIASAAILIHSLVDFPLRTGAISASFAMCLGLMSLRRPSPPRDPAELRPSRHLVFM